MSVQSYSLRAVKSVARRAGLRRVLLPGFLWARKVCEAAFLAALPMGWMIILSFSRKKMTKRADWDRYVICFLADSTYDVRALISKAELRREYPNEIADLAILLGYDDIVFELFSHLDLSKGATSTADHLSEFLKKYETGYRTNTVALLNAVDWSTMTGSPLVQFDKFIQSIIEHRIYDYEERMLVGKIIDSGCVPDDLETKEYVVEFFQDQDLVRSIYKDFRFGMQNLSDRNGGRHWECLPIGIENRNVFEDVSLFYAYRHLLLRNYHSGEGRTVPAVYKYLLETQSRLRRSSPRISGSLRTLLESRNVDIEHMSILSPDWSALIGHNGHLNIHLLMREMGWWSGSPILLATEDRIANRPFLSLFEERCPILILGRDVSDDLWRELVSLTPFYGASHQAFAFENGEAMYWNDAGAMAVSRWEAQGGGFPLRTIYDRHHADGHADQMLADMRRRWGMTDDDWFVCLHLRDTATRGETAGTGEAIRSTSFANYAEAVRHITDRGGWVIRMGGAKATPLPEMPRVIDYAVGPDQTPLMDIHLVRRAKMFIGTTSGFAYVASSFGIPTAMVNAISSVGLLWSKDTRFAVKPIRTKRGMMLSQRDVTSEEWRWAFPTHESLDRAGLTVAENSSDEIFETVKEVLDLCDGHESSALDLIVEWKSRLCIPEFYGSALPSSYFLNKYHEDFLREERS